MNIGIYLYDNAEVLDFSGPYEVFSTASRLSQIEKLFTVFLVGETGKEITARGDFIVRPHYSFFDHPDMDVLVAVGGVHAAEMRNRHTIQWLRKTCKTAKIVSSVCTGVFLLAEAGIISNQKVTTHREDIPDLERLFPRLDVLDKRRWVMDGNVITSGGVSAGIDMSLYVTSLLANQDLAEKTAKQLEYEWQKNPE